MMFQFKKLVSLSIVLQLLILLSIPAASQFQPSEVVRSQERTIINGKIYYIHTVLKGQTLYSISKAYNVTQDDILRVNPGTDPVLKEGQALRIPELNAKEAPVYPDNRNDFYAHTVKKGQTVYSISKKYKVDEEVIYAHNPWAREGIKADQTIWIPRNKDMQNVTEAGKTDDLFFFYTTKKGDTLYSISKIYNVTVADIIDHNPVLIDGLKPGQVLKIPKISTFLSDQVAQPDSVDTLSVSCMKQEEPAVFDVALLLPLFAEYSMEESVLPADSLNEDGIYIQGQKQRGLRGRNFAEFYEGFMLALDSLKKTGISLNLTVKDTERDTLLIKKIARELSQTRPDLIIGPVYSEDVDVAGRLADNLKTNLISPLSTRNSLVTSNPSIIQVVPSRHLEGLALANYLKDNGQGCIILIRGTDSTSMSNSWRFKKYFLERLDSLTAIRHFNDYKLNDSLLNVLDKVLKKDMDNIIVVFSDNEADVSRLISQLKKQISHPMKIYGMPTWQNWEDINIEYFHDLQINLITPFFTDYSNPLIKRFLYKCRSEYGYEPYEISSMGYNFTMLGYDIGFYFLSALNQYGKNFQPCLNEVEAEGLLTRYKFIREGEGGYTNCCFNLIQYKNDYTVEKVAVLSDVEP
jgi:LysM repeat protein/ABC-type branched-subunit amino acid transport system substrate-binding protein